VAYKTMVSVPLAHQAQFSGTTLLKNRNIKIKKNVKVLNVSLIYFPTGFISDIIIQDAYKLSEDFVTP
jgi:serine/threonine protein kinase HipA of HipAB toxin-antitoxin module